MGNNINHDEYTENTCDYEQHHQHFCTRGYRTRIYTPWNEYLDSGFLNQARMNHQIIETHVEGSQPIGMNPQGQ